MELFILNYYHIILLKNINIHITDNGFGFTYNTTTPSDLNIYDNIKKIIGNIYDGEIRDEFCEQVHKELPIALEVCMQSQSFTPGSYSKKNGGKWVRIKK